MKDTFYFSHDYNASSDEKIIKLLSRHGMAGYGIFWRIIEILYNNANALQTDYDRIAYELHITDTAIVESVVNDFGLFEFDGDCFGSTSIERRLNERNEKSEKARQSAFKRWGKVRADANALQNNANASKNDAIKERKGKDIKENKENIMSDAFSPDYKSRNLYESLAFKLWQACYTDRLSTNVKPTILLRAKPSIWAKEIRLMIDSDGRTESEVIEVLNFLRTNDFWLKNIQSADKLRKQFERLQLEMRKPKKGMGSLTRSEFGLAEKERTYSSNQTF